jgi:hypothetical protein
MQTTKNFKNSGFNLATFNTEEELNEALNAPSWILERVEINQSGYDIDLGFFAVWKPKKS